MERFACPSPDFRGRYRCIDDRSLCDGFFDCPSREDENPEMCLFYKTVRRQFVIRNLIGALCSRNFQNVKLRLDFFETRDNSSCEVNCNLLTDCWNTALINLIVPPLGFYVKSNFCELKRSKYVIFAKFRDSEFWNWVNLELKIAQIY